MKETNEEKIMHNNQNNVVLFIDAYKKLESKVEEVYNVPINRSKSSILATAYPELYNEINYCAQIRNLIQHAEKLDNEYPIEPSTNAIALVQKLIDKVSERKKCKEIYIPYNRIYKRNIDDSVKETINEMKLKVYSHVPIVDSEGVVEGVFDENSIFNYVDDEKTVEVEGLTFRDIKKYLTFDRRKMEKILFRKGDIYIDKIEKLFIRKFQDQSRLEVVFLTRSGKQNDKLIGMITPWDLLAKN